MKKYLVNLKEEKLKEKLNIISKELNDYFRQDKTKLDLLKTINNNIIFYLNKSSNQEKLLDEIVTLFHALKVDGKIKNLNLEQVKNTNLISFFEELASLNKKKQKEIQLNNNLYYIVSKILDIGGGKILKNVIKNDIVIKPKFGFESYILQKKQENVNFDNILSLIKQGKRKEVKEIMRNYKLKETELSLLNVICSDVRKLNINAVLKYINKPDEYNSIKLNRMLIKKINTFQTIIENDIEHMTFRRFAYFKMLDAVNHTKIAKYLLDLNEKYRFSYTLTLYKYKDESQRKKLLDIVDSLQNLIITKKFMRLIYQNSSIPKPLDFQ
ncbi:MAG: hypothetical protein N2505_00410 [Endomicrobia bacterium]|nr:hypothetical protein [Endomicrobiia bacterium]